MSTPRVNVEAAEEWDRMRRINPRSADVHVAADLAYLEATGRGLQFQGRLDKALDAHHVTQLAKKALLADGNFWPLYDPLFGLWPGGGAQ